MDDGAGGRTVVRHLLERGRRRILFVDGPLDLEQVRARLHGARKVVGAIARATLDVLLVAGLTARQGVDEAHEILTLGE